jgi:hypothetical protein
MEFGKWVVLSRDTENPGPPIRWICRCQCGLTKSVNGVTLRFGKSNGCHSCSKQGTPFARRYSPGDKVEKWTIVRFMVKKSAYLCRCECGRTATHGVARLKRGKPSCCATCSADDRRQTPHPPRIDHTGQTFGQWTVLSQDHTRAGAGMHWLCRCSCGETGSIPGFRLRSGSTTRCLQCSYKSRKGKSLVYSPGDRVGRWTIVRYRSEEVRYECRCECGRVALATVNNLRRGTTMGCMSCRSRAGTTQP